MEQRAFEQIALKLRLKAFQASRLLGADNMEAEDVAQEVMLRLWQMHRELKEESRLGNLASLMARNLTIDHLRKVKTISIEDSCPQPSIPSCTCVRWKDSRPKRFQNDWVLQRLPSVRCWQELDDHC